jgi:hypothetical protein
MDGVIRGGKGGWLRFDPDNRDDEIYFRVADLHGRLRIVELYISGSDSPIGTNTLRDVPIGMLEASVNAPDFAPAVRSLLDLPAVPLRVAASYYAHTWGTTMNPDTHEQEIYRPHWAADMYWSQFDDTGVPAAPLQRERRRTTQPTAPEPKLEMPTTRPWPDSFYQQLASVYSGLAGQVRNPAKVIAEANDVNVTQVHRWTRVARTKGFLPPATHGKRG